MSSNWIYKPLLSMNVGVGHTDYKLVVISVWFCLSLCILVFVLVQVNKILPEY